MTLIEELHRLLPSALVIVALASCGPPSLEPEPPAGPNARFRQATPPDLSAPKGGDPAGAMPSQVTSGGVTVFKDTPTISDVRKDREAAGSLPSNAAAGTSAAYAPDGGTQPSSPSSKPTHARMAAP